MSTISDEIKPNLIGKRKASARLIASEAFCIKEPSLIVIEQDPLGRAQRVCDMALYRGGIEIQLGQLQAIQNAIAEVKKAASESRPIDPRKPRWAWPIKKLHVDVFEVKIGRKNHCFLWCRRGKRIISYLAAGKCPPKKRETK
jgi:hypothetical protein